jgi:mannose-6-phosphate isomerase-like protein (cupin superfamily)
MPSGPREPLGVRNRTSKLALDCRAPAGFGVVRHLHHREDLVEGQIAVWMPDRCLTMTPGDLVFLPKEVEHAWRAYGEKSVRMNVTVSPGGFEHFFPTIKLAVSQPIVSKH